MARLARVPVELGAALAALDPAALTDEQAVDVLKAEYRQDNHGRGRLFAIVAEVMRRGLDGVDLPDDVWPVEFAADEVRAALVMTRNGRRSCARWPTMC